MVGHKKFINGVVEASIEEEIFIVYNDFGQDLFHEFGIYFFEVLFLPTGNRLNFLNFSQVLEQMRVLPKFFNVVYFQGIL